MIGIWLVMKVSFYDTVILN